MEYPDIDCHSDATCNWIILKYQNKFVKWTTEIWTCKAFLRMPHRIMEGCKLSVQLGVDTEDWCRKLLLWLYVIILDLLKMGILWYISKSAGTIWKNFLDFVVWYYSLADPFCHWSFAIGSVNKKLSFWHDIYTAKLSVPTNGSKISLVYQDTVSGDLKKIWLDNFTRNCTAKRFRYWLICSGLNPTVIIVFHRMFWIYFLTKTKAKP